MNTQDTTPMEFEQAGEETPIDVANDLIVWQNGEVQRFTKETAEIWDGTLVRRLHRQNPDATIYRRRAVAPTRTQHFKPLADGMDEVLSGITAAGDFMTWRDGEFGHPVVNDVLGVPVSVLHRHGARVYRPREIKPANHLGDTSKPIEPSLGQFLFDAHNRVADRCGLLVRRRVPWEEMPFNFQQACEETAQALVAEGMRRAGITDPSARGGGR